MIKLDAKDKKILYQLDVNSRMSLTQIGKNVKMSKENVFYRIKRLEKEKVILGYYTLVNPLNLDYQYFRIGITYHNINNESEQRLINFLKEKESVVWLGSHDNAFDLVAAVIVKSNNILYDLVKEIKFQFQENIQDINISLATAVHYFKSNIVHEANDFSYITWQHERVNYLIDEKDKIILNHLSKDSRVTSVELGRLTKLTPKNVISRIKKLEKNKIILGYLTNFNYQLLGLSYLKLLIYLSKTSMEIEKKVKGFFISKKKLIYITDGLGLADMEFEIIVKANNEIYSLIKELKETFPNYVKDFRSCSIFKVHKIRYFGEIV